MLSRAGAASADERTPADRNGVMTSSRTIPTCHRSLRFFLNEILSTNNPTVHAERSAIRVATLTQSGHMVRTCDANSDFLRAENPPT
jgi:hypothetical protein